MSRIARNLRDWRLDLDLTQDEAARYIGVSLRTYSGYETGTRIPPYRVWQRLMSVIRTTGEDQYRQAELVRG